MFCEEDGTTEVRQRCEGCKYKHIVHANGGYSFNGCYHRPYKGKRVAEIKECPKLKQNNNKEIITDE